MAVVGVPGSELGWDLGGVGALERLMEEGLALLYPPVHLQIPGSTLALGRNGESLSRSLSLFACNSQYSYIAGFEKGHTTHTHIQAVSCEL